MQWLRLLQQVLYQVADAVKELTSPEDPHSRLARPPESEEETVWCPAHVHRHEDKTFFNPFSSLMQVSRFWRSHCIPMYWSTLDLEGVSDTGLARIRDLLREDQNKSRVVKGLWVRSILDEDEVDDLKERSKYRRSLFDPRKRRPIITDIIVLCVNLQEIDVDFCFNYRAALNEALRLRQNSITSLTIANNDFDNVRTPERWITPLILCLPYLGHLRLDEVDAGCYPDRTTDGLGFAVASLSKLHTLHLWEVEPLNDVWADLDWKTDQMHTLAIDECPALSDHALDILIYKFHRTLTCLEVDLSPDGPRGPGSPLEMLDHGCLAPTYDLPELLGLVMGRLTCTTKWLDRFSHCPKLKMIHFEDLPNCGLIPLNEEAWRETGQPDQAFIDLFSNFKKWTALQTINWDVPDQNSFVEDRVAKLCDQRGWFFHRGDPDSDDDESDEWVDEDEDDDDLPDEDDDLMDEDGDLLDVTSY